MLLIPLQFISKEQTKFSYEMKNKISENEVLVQLNFAENYAFVAQNASISIMIKAQFFRMMFFYKSGHEWKHFSTLAMSECTIHDVTAV